MSWNLLVNQDMHFFPLPGHTKGAIMACPSSVVLVVQELRHQLYLVPILYSSIEVINFSSELSFLLAKLKTEIWHSFVCDVIIVNIQGGNPHPF